ncbi:MAG TPA: carotenoid oxygenase family protein [Burkholderiaceae bacterium]|nr:carotenoid oxygenase family protein [Burkholderiaceae bacterium]
MSAVLSPLPAADSLHGPLSRLRGFESLAREIDDAEVQVRGVLPPWLAGSFLLNGPALWDLPRGQYHHWFDGLAMLHRLRIEPGGPVRYRSRFAQSEDYAQSVAAGVPAFGAFDTPDPISLWGKLVTLRHPRSTDNPAVVMSRIGERWIASTETPHLLEFDPQTLRTIGRWPFEDEADIDLMSAHGITDAQGNYWNVGTKLGPKCIYKLFRVRPGAAQREVLGSIPVGAAGYTHGFAMTPRHALIWETAMRVQPLGFLLTRRAYIRNFKWNPGSGSRLHAVSLADGSVRSWNIAPMMCFHAIQAWEEGDELVAELCTYEDASIFEDLLLDRLRSSVAQNAVPRLTRYRLQPGQAEARAEVFGEAFELPQVHPKYFGQRRAGLAWGAGLDPAKRNGFLDRTMRLDLANGAVQTWQRANAVQLEPLFVPRPDGGAEDDGVLLVPTLADGDEGSVVGVLDAHTMECLATLHAPQVIPFGFHAAWAG